MKNGTYEKGSISLQRKEVVYEARFCLINSTLPDLIPQLPLLHPRELTYFNNLPSDLRKQSYLLGRVAAKQAIADLTGVHDMAAFYIDFGIFNFPVIKNIGNHNVQVCISHCDNIGIAIAYPEEHPLGIDIEEINHSTLSALETVITDHETSLLTGIKEDAAFSHGMLWTIKEALSKILRTGLMFDFKQIEVDILEKKEHIYLSSFRHFAQYKAISFPMSQHICSLVLPRNTTADISMLQRSIRHIIPGIKSGPSMP
ncbi:MAG: 4'-phosphopantetheinyl transferase superfamily protein [Chitinophaga sp.]|uniref:4'-phosphopantetheinyl transferase family protein n=1 Tax=Chitinophaga sp. TaxID=1869181 RepID=UPI001B03A3C9|nr:4'-phosphopantetheinyl transferase family protein [Chitinophaga sp.]MBO9729952.1 4'-phosphopantetheinyl transferase superfamily protein [Chitinophaga sp.]